jgi:hypothetical protein
VEAIQQVGAIVGEDILFLASFLRQEESPGIVVVVLLIVLIYAILHMFCKVRRQRAALRWLHKAIVETRGNPTFDESITRIDRMTAGPRRGARGSVATAWNEYRETLVPHEQDRVIALRNAVRPSVFFNIEDLHFGPGFWRIAPGLFVTVGLFLTFLGLISALDTMGDEMSRTGRLSEGAMTNLLAVASAKFIMSLTGLFCSIVFSVFLRLGMGNIERDINRLNGALEKRLSFISLEDLAIEQLKATREHREHFRSIGLELVAELGRPLREELPQAISSSISNAMSPLLTQIGQAGSEGVGEMVRDLSSRFSDDVGHALAQASDRLVQAGDHIGGLVERLDRSSGRMGSEMETAVTRLGQTLYDLQATLSAGASSASGALSDGAEAMLAAMNVSLERIRENTSEGAKAMSAAAAEMRVAAEGFRAELEAAARQGSEVAKARMQEASDEASVAIDGAGAAVLEAFEKSSAEIVRMTEELTARAGADLLVPMNTVAEKLDALTVALSEGAVQVRRASEGMRAGAEATTEAAGAFRGSADALVSATAPVRATVERLEGSTRHLAESTRAVADGVRGNAESTAQALAAAQEILGGEQRAIQSTLAGLAQALERMHGQGERLDDLDEKLGAAFETYTTQVEAAVRTLYTHVRDLQEKLAPALDTMREIVEQAEQFAPQARRA